VAVKKVTIEAIAHAAGVSPATVSRVLNNKRNVRPELAVRVKEVIATLGYRPNEIARGLVNGRASVFSVVVPDIDNPFFSKICKAIQDTIGKDKYSLFLYNSNGALDREKEIIEELAARLIKGVFLVAPRTPPKDILDLCKHYDILPVVLDARVESYRLPAVWVDNTTAFIEATEYLIRNGHRKIGFVAGPHIVANSEDRLRGYLLGLQRYSIEKAESLILESDYTIAGGYKAAEYMFEKIESQPTALICSNDLMAVGVMAYLRQKGIQIPDEVSIIGCDDIDVAGSLYPPLTTIVQPISKLGTVAAQLMLQYISHDELPPKVILHAELVVRESTSSNHEEVSNVGI